MPVEGCGLLRAGGMLLNPLHLVRIAGPAELLRAAVEYQKPLRSLGAWCLPKSWEAESPVHIGS